MKNKKYTAGDIKILSGEEWLELRLFKDLSLHTNTLYVIVGFLQEYFGGYSLDKETVDSFFVNELDKAKLFSKVCVKFLEEQKLETDVSLHITETGHSYVESKQICRQLKKMYRVRKLDFLTHTCYQLPANDDLFKHPKDLYPEKKYPLWNFNQISFLTGAFIKNKGRRRDSLVFANAGHKAEITINFLNLLCGPGDRISVDYLFNVPHATVIRYKKDGPFISGFLKYIKKFSAEL